MRVFKSLNCTLCKEPFARSADQPRSPRRLLCGSAMCYECCEKEKSLTKKERKHQCNNVDCFESREFACFLIDVFSQDSLTLSESGDGYFLLKPFKIPQCPICHDEYNMEVKKPFVLACAHSICTECYLKKRETTPEDSSKKEFNYDITCPICNEGIAVSANGLEDNFHDFLNELPKMTRQLDLMEKSCSCNECHKTDGIEEMFHCSSCTFEICGTCAFNQHRLHEAIPLLEKRVCELGVEHQKGLTDACDENEGFLEAHKCVTSRIDIFLQKLQITRITLLTNERFQLYDEIRALNETFDKDLNN